jgi:rRNA maturation protein Nop10
MKHTPICPVCGDREVSVKLPAHWDQQAQTWALDNLPAEDHYCETCGDLTEKAYTVEFDLDDDGNIDFNWVDSSTLH